MAAAPRAASSAFSSGPTRWLVGRYDRDENGMGYVVPFDRRVLMDIFVPPGQEGGASPGEMVSLELTRWPTSTRGAIGRVADVLGDIDAPGVDTEIIIRKYGIPDAHSSDAIREVDRARVTACTERDLPARTDFRDRLTVTIDGEHARDFDDAITIEKLPNGTLLAGRAHRRRVALRAGRQRPRSRGLRARAHRSTFPSAPSTCSRPSWRPDCAV